MNTTVLSRSLHWLWARPRRALLAIFGFIVIAGVIGGPLAGSLKSGDGFVPADADSARAVERVEAASGKAPSAEIILLVDTPDGASSDTVDTALDTLDSLSGIADVTPAGSAADGESALVAGTLNADAVEGDVGADVVDAFADNPDVTVGGQAVANLQLSEQISRDLGRAEMLAFPILVLLSILFFRGRAAVLPLIVGITTVLGAFLALTGINQFYGLSVFALNLIIGLGLGLAIDYTLFLVTRYREELEQQGDTFDAVRTTMRTAGRTVAFSAATVAVALATLTAFPMNFLKSMGIAGAVVAIVAALASLIVTPAILGVWGVKVARRTPHGSTADGRWYRLSHAVMRRPGIIAVVTATVMVVLAAPALGAKWTPVDSSVVPTDLSARVVSDTVAEEYDGAGTTPVSMAIESDDPAAVSALADNASALPGVAAAADISDLGHDTWQVDLTVVGDAAGDDAQHVVSEVRALASESGVDALAAGPAAEFIDQQDAIADTLPLAVTLLVLLTMVILWLMTGSVVLPIKAVVMNALTVGVSLGALTFIYQDGRFTDLLGYTPNGGIEPTNFLVAAALVFALSTDYGVFLLGRIKEARESGLSEREAVATGLGRTGSVVTAAAILLAVAIGAFSTSSISFVQQIGLATAVGVLVDAFVVRSLLVPSLMGLMGKWNWWAPMSLRRLHDKVGLSEAADEPVLVGSRS